uniref:ParE toxin of type II toxin-antitoxin system, parDE n=1 Tax=Candidatus Kentrum sp. SD TaxID=2126332 RepID=A0A451BMK4_9GAMM|nr:MAG: ParE toxin of type II toxin-antitoxin system, parDE [Candidatus Kentron sp. SD]
MSGYRLVITEEAASDIANARRWYQEQAGLGAAFIEQVEEQLEFIERHPQARPDIARGISYIA